MNKEQKIIQDKQKLAILPDSQRQPDLNALEAKAHRDIGLPFFWLESQLSNPDLSAQIAQSGVPESFALVLQCALKIFKNDLIAAGALLRNIEQQGDPYHCADLLIGLFHSRASQYEKAANAYFIAINQHKSSLYGWLKLLDLSLDAGMITQGLQWYRHAISMSGWSTARRIDLLQAGILLLVNNYEFDRAIESAKQRIVLQMQLPVYDYSVDDQPFNVNNAWAALVELLDFLEPYDLRLFPTAGTLLGWQRQGGILPFDKDLDLALMPGKDNLMLAINVLSGLPRYRFASRAIKSASYVGIIDSKTGVTFDLLEFWEQEGHYAYGWRLPGKYRTYSRILRFTPFSLIRDSWHGRPMWRPDNADRYLTELYGDWRTPDPYFDSCAGPVNLQRFTPLVQAIAYGQLTSELTRGNFAKARSYVASLRRHKDDDPLLDQLDDWIQKQT